MDGHVSVPDPIAELRLVFEERGRYLAPAIPHKESARANPARGELDAVSLEV